MFQFDANKAPFGDVLSFFDFLLYLAGAIMTGLTKVGTMWITRFSSSSFDPQWLSILLAIVDLTYSTVQVLQHLKDRLIFTNKN